jgi:hypothetical protein
MRLRRSCGCAFVTILCGLSAASAAHAAKRPTVTAELSRLAAAGAITPVDASAYRATYIDARAQVKALTGARKAELGGVVDDLQDMAARSRFTPSRLPALFLTLRRNAQYWPGGALLSAGARLSFSGSELMYQFYPGHGLQIQWLGTFGKLNGYWKGGRRYDARAGALLSEALPLAAERAGGLAWEYLFPFDGQKPPWVSSLAQGTGLQAMARVAVAQGRQAEVFPIAQRGLAIFQTPPPDGVRVPDGAGAHYLQYSGLARLKILNGFIQSLVGLFDYASLTGDPTARALFDAGDAAARAEVPQFDTGAWSLYSRGSASVESDLGYHNLLRDFLVQLCTRTAAIEYCSAAQHFTSYLTIPPVVEMLPSEPRANRVGELRFKLSKISRVSVKVTRAGRAVMARDAGTVGRGTRTLAWRAPKRTGVYDVTVTATDLVGNVASSAGQVEVGRPRT